MDKKTKIQTVISLVLVVLITGLAYWAQVPSKDLKAQLIDVDTILIRIQDFAFDPDTVRIDQNTAVSWLNDESEANADVQHTVTSYDPEDASVAGELFESEVMSRGDETFTYLFDEPGVYYYNCSLYPFMTGKVCVGDESEVLDDDCAMDLTDVEFPGAAEPEEDTLLGEDLLPDLEEVPDEDLLGDELGALEDEDLLAEDTEEEGLLFEAADEDFTGQLIEGDNGSATVFFPPENGGIAAASTNGTTADGADLTDSGPEDLIYLIPLIFAFFVAKKLADRKA
ncbi:plastocyanin/azurin family copper-binding protein [Patescibacteria group bacterium]